MSGRPIKRTLRENVRSARDVLPRSVQFSVAIDTLHRTGFAPVGRRTKFHDVTASSLPFDQPCLVAPCTNASHRRS